MKEQAGLYHEMATVLEEMANNGGVDAGAEKLAVLVSSFRDLRSRTSALEKPSEEDVLRLANLPGQAEAHEAFFKAQSAFFSSKNASSKINDILAGLHESVPVKGEGNP